MNSFSALHGYDLKTRLHRLELYQIFAFCGHVFRVKFQLKKVTIVHMTGNKYGYQLHISVTFILCQHESVWRCLCSVQSLCVPFCAKCINRILQMHHQNPVVPPESAVHPENPICTNSVTPRELIKSACPLNIWIKIITKWISNIRIGQFHRYHLEFYE